MNEVRTLESGEVEKRGPRRAREEVEAVVARYERSGLTLKAFAVREGLKEGGLRSWVYQARRRRRAKGSEPTASGGFAAVKITEDEGARAKLSWPNGMAAELAVSEAGLVRILRELALPCSR